MLPTTKNKLLHCTSGATAIEYALLVSLISVVAITTLTTGTEVLRMFDSITAAF